MVQQASFQNSFVSGELSPDAWERSDMAQYATGCEEAFNLIGLTQGPDASRGGFRDAGSPKYQDKARRCFTWLRGDGEGLVLELGHLYGRLWTARGAPLLNGGAPVEFAHPYTEAQLPDLRMHQVGDIAIVSDRAGSNLQVIKRNSDISWSCGAYALTDGPWLPENGTPAAFQMNDNGDGTWHIVANFDYFRAYHVGTSLRIRPPGGFPGYRTWAPNTAVPAGSIWYSAGRVYQWMGGATTGNTPPQHDSGDVSDGGVTWRYLHDGSAIIKITAVADNLNATGTWTTTPCVETGLWTASWSEQVFNAVHGWPSALAAVREERLVLAASGAAPDMLTLSQTAGFDVAGASFKPGLGTGEVADDDAVRAGIGDKKARIVWAVDALNLIVGTTDAEYVVSGATVDDPIAPAAVEPRRISGHGSADVMPVVVQGPPILLLHVARGGRTLRELQLSSSVIAPAGRDLSILAQHVFGLLVKEMAWARTDSLLWLRLGDDSLAAYTYHFEEGVFGVRRQPLPGGWKVEGLATSPDPDGGDRLHLAAYRTKGGATQRAQFVLSRREEALFIDCAQQYAGAPVTTIDGLERLAGEQVAVLADGASVGLLTVSAEGEITLPAPASAVSAGLPLLRRWKGLPWDPDRSGGTTGKKVRPTHAYVTLSCAFADVKCEAQDEAEGSVIWFETVSSRRPSDAVPVVRRKRQKVFFGADADRDVRLIVETSEPFDLVIRALRPAGDAQ